MLLENVFVSFIVNHLVDSNFGKSCQSRIMKRSLELVGGYSQLFIKQEVNEDGDVDGQTQQYLTRFL